MSLSLSRKRRNQELNGVSVSQTQTESEAPTNKRNRSEAALPSNSDVSKRLSQSQRVSVNGAEDSHRCGKILRVHLTNFMCHSNLVVEFHPRINFLVGNNGSGKSAVLAALVLGLGANARATNRSSNIKQFIKSGESSAKIEITISNDGSQAYEPEVYGESITVVRTLSMSSSGYVIKNASGHVVSKKVAVLQRILMYHNIQVDNPVFVLNQDSAREFLKELEPRKNYSLFLKATQIEIVVEKLNECLYLHKAHLNDLNCFKMKLQKSHQDIEEHKAKLKELLSFEKLKDILKRCELEYLWLLVEKHEEKLSQINENLENIEKEKREIHKMIQNKDKVNLELTQKIRKYEDEVEEKNSAYNEASVQQRQLRSKVSEIHSRCMEIKMIIESLKEKKTRFESSINELKQHIEERSKQNQSDIDSMRRENDGKLKEYRREYQVDLTSIIESLKRDLQIFLSDKSQKETALVELKRKQNDISANLRHLNVQINNVHASAKDKLLIYGEHMPQLLNEIKKVYEEGKFSALPRGPIGSFVEVPNNKYRNVVEYLINPYLKAFVVSNAKDRLVLENILKQKFPNTRLMIITTKFMNKVYDVHKGCVSPPVGTRLLMQEIQCTDPVVMNCLIDHVQIETILLADSKETAENITSTSENVPRNLQKVVVPNPGLEYFPVPKYRMYSIRIPNACVIQVNVQERISQLEMEKATLEKQIRSYDTELIELKKEISKNSKLIAEKRVLLEKHESKRHELHEKIIELENVEYPDFNEVEILKKEIVDIEVKLEKVKRALSAKETELLDTTKEKEDSERELITQQNVLKELQNEIETIKINHDQHKMELRSLADNERQSRAKICELKNTYALHEQEKMEVVEALNKATKAAQSHGERIPTRHSVDEILEKIAKIKARIKHGIQVNVDSNTLRELIQTKEESLEVERGTYDNIKSSISMLRKSLDARFDFLKKLKEHMSLLIQFAFNCILKLRNFEGAIDVNHQDKTLTISVVPRDHNKKAVSSTKALSGGERSYSTVAFLISLWACVDHPFYFLDEYDVFTDEVNREYMTRLLINEGRKRPRRQYTFLTPQEMTLQPEKCIKIHKLAEPERR